MELSIPAPVLEQIDQLNQLVKKYPKKMPLQVAAEFMGLSEHDFRALAETQRCAFAQSWTKPGSNYRQTYIGTLPMYLWYVGPALMFAQQFHQSDTPTARKDG